MNESDIISIAIHHDNIFVVKFNWKRSDVPTSKTELEKFARPILRSEISTCDVGCIDILIGDLWQELSQQLLAEPMPKQIGEKINY